MRNTAYDDIKNYITPETVELYARTNEALIECGAEIKGIIVELPGLGGGSCLGGLPERGTYDTRRALDFAQKGILLAYIFPGPWSWGGRGTVRITDAVVAALAEKYALGENFPLSVCGGSMGGLGALIYSVDTAYKVRGVVAACPCVDVPSSFNVHPDFPRTYISAVAAYDMPIASALESISPMARIDDMRQVPYFICSDGEDSLFPPEQCERLVELMRCAGHEVIYREQPNKLHGEFLPEVRNELHSFLIKTIIGE